MNDFFLEAIAELLLTGICLWNRSHTFTSPCVGYDRTCIVSARLIKRTVSCFGLCLQPCGTCTRWPLIFEPSKKRKEQMLYYRVLLVLIITWLECCEWDCWVHECLSQECEHSVANQSDHLLYPGRIFTYYQSQLVLVIAIYGSTTVMGCLILCPGRSTGS